MTIHRSEIYKAWIRTQTSIVSGRTPCEAHHEPVLKEANGMGMKTHDCLCLPLTAEEHRERHQTGKDTFYNKYGIDPMIEIIRHNARYLAEKGIK